LDFAESNKHYAETLKEYSKELEKIIETASSSELGKIIDTWPRTIKKITIINDNKKR